MQHTTTIVALDLIAAVRLARELIELADLAGVLDLDDAERHELATMLGDERLRLAAQVRQNGRVDGDEPPAAPGAFPDYLLDADTD